VSAPYEALRPEFAADLLTRLERARTRRPLAPMLRGAAAGATVTATLFLFLVNRRRTR
jgi:hypothetical protein